MAGVNRGKGNRQRLSAASVLMFPSTKCRYKPCCEGLIHFDFLFNIGGKILSIHPENPSVLWCETNVHRFSSRCVLHRFRLRNLKSFQAKSECRFLRIKCKLEFACGLDFLARSTNIPTKESRQNLWEFHAYQKNKMLIWLICYPKFCSSSC